MFKIIAFVAIMTASTFAHAVDQTVSVCFRQPDRKIAKLRFDGRFAAIDWDLSAAGNYSKESGHVTNYKYIRASDTIEFQAFLQNSVTDGSDYRFTVAPTTVTVQGLWSNGRPIGNPEPRPTVRCPN